MDERETRQIRELVESVYCSESRRVLVTLIRLLGDFESAEEALHEVVAVAISLRKICGLSTNFECPS